MVDKKYYFDNHFKFTAILVKIVLLDVAPTKKAVPRRKRPLRIFEPGKVSFPYAGINQFRFKGYNLRPLRPPLTR